jgi:hypothetical protein
MFIDRSKLKHPAPFEGAEFKLSCIRQDPFRSFERRWRGLALRSINMLPMLRGEDESALEWRITNFTVSCEALLGKMIHEFTKQHQS